MNRDIDIYDLYALTISTDVHLDKQTRKIVIKGYVPGYLKVAFSEYNWDGKDLRDYRIYQLIDEFKHDIARMVLEEDFLKDEDDM